MSLHLAFSYLVDKLRAVKSVKSVRILDEGALHVNVAQPSFHEDIVIYLLAGELSVGFVKKTLNANTQRDMHTLFIVAFDLLSADGATAHLSDALRLLLHAYGGKVYAYRTSAAGVAIVPVYIDRSGRLTCGDPVNLADLSGDYATFDNKYLLGVRKVASFTAQHVHHETVQPPPDDPLKAYYDLLGVNHAASEADIKKAYRRKARQHHPDTDKSPDATAKMQAINDAYERIMERLRSY